MKKEVEKKTIWICGVCGGTHSSEDDAVACAKSHQKISAVEDHWYFKNKQYPERVLVVFENGVKAWFSLDKECLW